MCAVPNMVFCLLLLLLLVIVLVVERKMPKNEEFLQYLQNRVHKW